MTVFKLAQSSPLFIARLNYFSDASMLFVAIQLLLEQAHPLLQVGFIAVALQQVQQSLVGMALGTLAHSL